MPVKTKGIMFRMHIQRVALLSALIIFVTARPLPAQTAPLAFTQAARADSETSAFLNGMVVPKGYNTTAWFEWGSGGNYSQSTEPISTGNGMTVVRVTAGISNLPVQSDFECRLVASNQLGVTRGAPVWLTTGRTVSMWGDNSAGQLFIPAGLTNVTAMGSGGFHSLALKADGALEAWGLNNYGQTNVPAGLSNVAAVAAGEYHCLALKADGTVTAWGLNNSGQANVPSGLSNVVAVVAGENHSLALKANGQVVAWGKTNNGQATVPAGLSNIVSLAGGDAHSVALKADGTVTAWGSNTYGLTNVPAGLSNVVAIAAGVAHTLALKADGTVAVWGDDQFYQTVMPDGLSNVIAIAAGAFHSLALKTDGSVVAWGDNSYGQTNIPAVLSHAVAVGGAYYNSLALTGNLPPQAEGQTNCGVALVDLTLTLRGLDPNGDPLSYRVTTLPAAGMLYQWTPDGRGTPITTPDTLVEDSGNRVIFEPPAVPADSFTFVANDGRIDSSPAVVLVTNIPARLFTQPTHPAGPAAATLRASVLAGAGTRIWFEWGASGEFENQTEPLDLPVTGRLAQVSTLLTNLTELTHYQYRVVTSNALGLARGNPVFFTTGQWICPWGSNSSKQSTVPRGTGTAVAVAAGGWHSLALKADGTVVGWGSRYVEQSTVPPGLSNVVSIAAGDYQSLALQVDGTVVAWGNASFGLNQVPADLGTVMEVASGGYHNLVLKDDGTVRAWGDNQYGQTNVPAGLSNVVAVAAGGFHSLALTIDGTVVAWGLNIYGETSIPDGLGQAWGIAGGRYQSLAIGLDGKVAAWGAVGGNISFGQGVVPPGLTNAIAITVSGGFVHSVALKADRTVIAWGADSITYNRGQTAIPAGLSNVVAVVAGGYHNVSLGCNLPPQAISQTNTGVAFLDTTIALPATDPNGDILTYRVLTLPSVGSLYQWTTNGRGTPITAPNTPVDDPDGRVILWMPAENADTFQFSASDGFTESAPGTVYFSAARAWVFTRPPQPAGPAGATLCGAVLAGSGSQARFEWGVAGSYDQQSAALDLATPGVLTQVSTQLTNLAPGVNYQYRVVSSNAAGLAYGAPFRFNTGQRISAWGNNASGQASVPSGLTNAVAIAAGANHSLALKPDGTLAAWGTNSEGQAVVPSGLGAVMGVAAGANHNLALTGDGTVLSWGASASGQTNVPADLSNVVAVAGGSDHSLALKSDGTVVAWGLSTSGQTNVPTSLSNVVAVAAGASHSLALRVDGTVVMWGTNNFGQTNLPASLSNVVAAACGAQHSLALKSDGTVVAWGLNTSGQTNVPAGLSNVVAVAAGASHSLALKGDGTAVAWGANPSGQANIPPGLTNVTAVAGGGTHSLALGANLPPLALAQTNSGIAPLELTVTLQGRDSNGDALTYGVATLPVQGALYQWTTNGRGSPITTPNTAVNDPGGRVIFYVPLVGTDSFTFVAKDGLADSAPATVFATGKRSSAFTRPPQPAGSDGATLCGAVLAGSGTKAWFEWGLAGGYGDQTAALDLATPGLLAQVSTLLTNLAPGVNYQYRVVSSNATGLVYGAPVRFNTGQRISAWGNNASGQASVPPGLTNAVAIAAGASHSLALKPDGTLAAWGTNGDGQIIVPSGLSAVMGVAAGANHNLALMGDGTVLSWGASASGQTNVPTGLSNVVAVAGGGDHSLALKSDGTVVAWGLNTSGQTNVPTSLSNVVAVAAGASHSLALRVDGTVSAWGGNTSGQTNVPAGLSNVLAVAAGGGHNLVLRSDGRVVAWGLNFIGQANVPAGLSNVVAVAAGAYHSLALKSDGTIVAWGAYPYFPPGLSNVTAVAGGGAHSLALGANLPPLALAQTNSGIAPLELTVNLQGSDYNGDTLTYSVATLPVQGTLYQWTTNGRGSPITAPNTAVDDPGGRVIYYVPVAGSDSFTFVARDGIADSAPATVFATGKRSSVFTRPPQPAGSGGAMLCGAVLAGSGTKAWFEWGLAGGYGDQTAALDLATPGMLAQVSTLLTNLAPGVHYQYRLASSNAAGLVYGAPVHFNTQDKVKAWGNNTYGQATVPSLLTNAFAMAGGMNHSVALKTDGTVMAWGANATGQTNVPAGLSNLVAVAGGASHSLALKSDGTVSAWGSNSYGQTNVPASLSNAVAVASGDQHNLALTSDGRVVSWGLNSSGQTNVPAGLSNVVAVAAGASHSLALRADGSVSAWGLNTSGQTNVPTGLSNVVAVAAGGSHNLALRSDGRVVAWGLNSSGQTNVPAGLTNVVAVAAGGSHSLALKSDGQVVAWGLNNSGQATVLAGLSNAVAVAAGGNHSLALGGNVPPQALAQTNSGTALVDLTITLRGSDYDGDALTYSVSALPFQGALYQWTTNGRGSPITAPNTAVDDPGGRVIYYVPVAGTDSFTFVARDGSADSAPATVFATSKPTSAFTRPPQPAGPGGATLCGTMLAGNGTKVWFEWGTAGGYGEQTAAMDLATPGMLTQVTTLITNLAPGINYQYRLVSSNQAGVVYGMPVLFSTRQRVKAAGGNSYVPTGLSNVMAVAAGYLHLLALESQGTVVSWGGINYGETNVPPGLSNVVAVAGGGSYSLALRADGKVVGWGYNGYGQTSPPAGVSNVVAIAAGNDHCLALRDNGTVVAWGNNASGQTNVPAGLNNVVSVATGYEHSLALKADGMVVAWGLNSYGQTNVPAGLSNVVAVAGGQNHSLALKADGTVTAWGDNQDGQTSVPPGLSNVIAVSGGEYHNLALKLDGSVVAWGYNGSGQSTIPAGWNNLVAASAGLNFNLALGGNLPPQALAQTNPAVPPPEFTITLAGTDPNNDALTFRVLTLPAAGQLYQWTSAGCGPAITAINTPVDDANGRIIYHRPEAGSDSFTFAADDGLADSAPAVVTVCLVQPPVLSPGSTGLNEDGSFTLSFMADTKRVWNVWGSTNLTSWDALGPAMQVAPSVFEYTDITATNWPQRFYRVTSP
jgi:alpha-tubulin suppressor-like RCC1 family protein